MAKINLERSGGMLNHSTDFTFDLDSLPADYARDLFQLIQEADFFNLPKNLIKHPDPEKIQYRITVEAGNTSHSVQTNEDTAPSSLRALLIELSKMMDNQPA